MIVRVEHPCTIDKFLFAIYNIKLHKTRQYLHVCYVLLTFFSESAFDEPKTKTSE